MSLPLVIFVANAGATFCLVGLIWTVQLVHYPTFHYVDEARFRAFEAFHQRRISCVVLPLMMAEALTSLLLPWLSPDFVSKPLAFLGLAMVALAWLSTFLLQVPLHTALSSGFSADAARRLVTTNWVRTIAWSARGVLVAWLLIAALSPGVRHP